jgi:hypothetical protein
VPVDIFTSFSADRNTHPAQHLTQGNTLYMIAEDGSPTEMLYVVTGTPQDFTTSITVIPLTVDPFFSGEGVLSPPVWRDNQLWFAHLTRCVPGGDTEIRYCIKLVELSTVGPSVTQDLTFGIQGVNVIRPALTTDVSNNMRLIFGTFSAT